MGSFFSLKFENQNELVIYESNIFIVQKYMIGSRLRIALLGGFFTFAFAMLFLAFFQDYVKAETLEWLPVSIIWVVDASDINSVVDHEIVPSFWMAHGSAFTFDFESDSSYQKFLHDEHPFDNIDYIPTDLLPINSNFTANNSKAFKLREEAGVEFADMAWHFWNAFSGDRLYIASAYRSKWFQDFMIRQWCSLQKCAKPWTSEHQAWLAVDLKVITKWWRAYSLDFAYPNKYSDRLKNNAASFGFHNTYQKWIEIDGKIAEWRHRRYVGEELATLLMENDQTFAEYYNWIQN